MAIRGGFGLSLLDVDSERWTGIDDRRGQVVPTCSSATVGNGGSDTTVMVMGMMMLVAVSVDTAVVGVSRRHGLVVVGGAGHLEAIVVHLQPVASQLVVFDRVRLLEAGQSGAGRRAATTRRELLPRCGGTLSLCLRLQGRMLLLFCWAAFACTSAWGTRTLLANTGSLLERSVSRPSSSVEDDSNSRSASGGSVVGARVDGPALNGLGSSSFADGMLSLEPPNVDGLSSSPTSVSLELLECCAWSASSNMLVVELLLLLSPVALRRLSFGWSLAPEAESEPLRAGCVGVGGCGRGVGLPLVVRLAVWGVTDVGSTDRTADGTGEVATRDSSWGAPGNSRLESSGSCGA
uniref:Uncharacterized protein n=1 Tax=Anopheles atroparvus TaxID=41427 RepID=A0A182JDP0_ANOAO